MSASPSPSANSPSIYTKQFLLLCLSSFLFFCSFNLIVAELPKYLADLGGAEYKGLIIALFTITALLSRPFSGKLVDKIGRLPVMIFGVVVSGTVGVLYPVLTSVSGFLMLRLAHGFSTGFTPTGTSALVADLIPENRRGEAMGIIGFCGSLGFATGPILGSYILLASNYDWMFYSSSIAAVLSIVILLGMKETLVDRDRMRLRHLAIGPNDIFDVKVARPAITLLLNLFSFGVMLTVLPDYAEKLGFENKSIPLGAYVIASMVIRIIGGRLSDRHGREIVVIWGTIGVAASCITLAFADTQLSLLLACGFFGLTNGIITPTVFAWTVDLSEANRRGRAISSVFIALEAGIMMGAFSSGWIINHFTENFKVAFLASSVTALLASAFLLLTRKRKARKGLAS